MKYFFLVVAILAVFGCQPTTDSHPNHLVNESSPYLLQHAYNPVDWYPWNEDALAKAKSDDKLMVISVGYSSCHWCHVMEHESFEDTTVARIMNDHFVSIKVDREERPDVDDVYMTACQIASGRGCGWPLNAFALPDGRPVWAGTYFPKDNWMEILTYFQELYATDREKLEQYAVDLMNGISSVTTVDLNTDDQDFNASKLTEYADAILANMDMEKGGRIGVEKFPTPGQFDFLMKYGTLMEDDQAIQAVEVSMTEMANGGIYDHVDGGWSRYSVDPEWHVPHFEKMLYDNGQLISLYSKAFQRTQNELYKNRVVETLDFIDRQWTDQSGGIYSSYDADSENEFGHKEEGAFYVWNKEEVKSILGNSPPTDAFLDYFDIQEKGNWEETNVLRITASLESVSDKHQINPNDFQKYIDASILQLRKERAKRKAPGLDDKILTSWNALMLQGYIDAYRAIGDDTYKSKAMSIAQFIKSEMIQSDYRLLRNYKDGKSVINAFLEDYALTAVAFVSMYEITFDEAWLRDAEGLVQYADQYFYNTENKFYNYTSSEDPPLIAQSTDYSDTDIPGANSAMARVLYTLGTFLNNQSYKDRSLQMLHNILPSIGSVDNPSYFYNWLSLYIDIVHPPYEVAILGNDYSEKLTELQSKYIPNAHYLGGTSEGSLELLKNKLIDGQTMIYVCQNKVCKLPTEDVEEAYRLLGY